MAKQSFSSILVLIWMAASVSVCQLPAQEQAKPDHSYKPLIVRLDEKGDKYIRFILWHQQWVQTNNLAEPDTRMQWSTGIRRSRLLAYAQVSPRFLILTHFGLNNLTTANLTALGNNGNGPQLFLHDAWAEYKISESIYLGGGLHYWNGLTRLSSQSTLSFMTLDNPRPFVHWHSLGITDQFARHLGLYAKGTIGRLSYRLAVNNPMNPANAIGAGQDYATNSRGYTYTGSAVSASGSATGNTVLAGYANYALWDQESSKLPYFTGTYLGSKRVFSLGAGFFAHPKGMYNEELNAHENVTHLAADAFLDAPLAGGDCLNAYLSLARFNYGPNYVSRWAGTGTVVYGHVGYKLPKLEIMPYIAYQQGNYDGFEKPVRAFNTGINYFIQEHHAKLTLDYHRISNDPRETPEGAVSQIRLQAQVFL